MIQTPRTEKARIDIKSRPKIFRNAEISMGYTARRSLVIIGHYGLPTPSRLSEAKMICTIRAERDRHGRGRVALVGLVALAAFVVSGHAGRAQQQNDILKQGNSILKQGAKLLR